MKISHLWGSWQSRAQAPGGEVLDSVRSLANKMKDKRLFDILQAWFRILDIGYWNSGFTSTVTRHSLPSLAIVDKRLFSESSCSTRDEKIVFHDAAKKSYQSHQFSAINKMSKRQMYESWQEKTNPHYTPKTLIWFLPFNLWSTLVQSGHSASPLPVKIRVP